MKNIKNVYLMIHNHEVRSSILRLATTKSLPVITGRLFVVKHPLRRITGGNSLANKELSIRYKIRLDL